MQSAYHTNVLEQKWARPFSLFRLFFILPFILSQFTSIAVCHKDQKRIFLSFILYIKIKWERFCLSVSFLVCTSSFSSKWLERRNILNEKSWKNKIKRKNTNDRQNGTMNYGCNMKMDNHTQNDSDRMKNNKKTKQRRSF